PVSMSMPASSILNSLRPIGETNEPTNVLKPVFVLQANILSACPNVPQSLHERLILPPGTSVERGEFVLTPAQAAGVYSNNAALPSGVGDEMDRSPPTARILLFFSR